MKWLVLAFITVPALEFYLLIQLGMFLGALNTLLFIIFTGVVGASLARMQGMAVLRDIQNTMNTGQLPARELIEGACVVFCGALLLTPGMITDLFGVLAMMPFCRRPLAQKLQAFFKARMVAKAGRSAAEQVVIDMEPTQQTSSQTDYFNRTLNERSQP